MDITVTDDQGNTYEVVRWVITTEHGNNHIVGFTFQIEGAFTPAEPPKPKFTPGYFRKKTISDAHNRRPAEYWWCDPETNHPGEYERVKVEPE